MRISANEMALWRLEDTIIAISTPVGYSGLGIIRLSGENALSIAQKIWKPKRRMERGIPPRLMIFGEIFDREKKKPIDEAYAVFFPEPNSYTSEDLVEISCHGSPVILEEVVRLGIKAGARHAHPGEFTLRAYLRGRIDVLQAEAVNDLITATSLHQAEVSFSQVQGRLSQKIGDIRHQIIQLLSQVEASIEFPEENLSISSRHIAKNHRALISVIKKLIDSFESGRALREGLSLAIVGRANVGKSTLFNALLEEERAIVSPYPGTTRDYLKESIKIKNSIFHLIDMAGIERPSHPVEIEGIRKGREMAGGADGILLLLDSSRPESAADLRMIQRFQDKKAILLFNKSDLAEKINMDKCLALHKSHVWLKISALKGTNLNKLRQMIFEYFVPQKSFGDETILHIRQRLLLDQIKSALDSSLELLNQGYSEEVYAEDLRRALPLIGKLTGEIRGDDIIEEIFSRFCVGK